MTICPWCKPDPPDDVDPGQLCMAHLAEHDGLTVDQIEEAEYAEWYDTA